MPSTAPEPDRPVQLRNDVNDLYALVGQVQSTVRGIADTQKQHGVRLGLLEAGVVELRRDVNELHGDVRELRRDVTELREGQDEILQLLRARP